MAFLCPSQLAIKRKILQPSKKPLPPDAYVPSTNGVETGARRSSLKDTSRNSSTKSEHRTVRIQDDFKDSKFRHETLVERRIKAATPAKPANIRVKILHDFEPSDNEELQVREGQFVKIIYQKNDWLYVVDSLENEGFIPFSYCSTFNTSTNSKSSTSGCDEDSYEDGILEDSFERLTIEKLDIKSEKRRHSKSPSRTRNKLKTSPVTYFPKRAYGPQMTVLYDYEAGDENDVNVRRGDFVMLLNDQDPDWFWVMTGRGEEGFIPRAFVMAHTCEECHKRLHSCTTVTSLDTADVNLSDVTATSSSSFGGIHSFTDYTSSCSSQDKKCLLKGTRLIVLFEYQASAFDDLSVRPGEYVYANLKDQIAPGWVWAYSPRKKRTGYIPQDYVKEPVVTEI